MCNMHPVVHDIPDDPIHPSKRDRQRQMEQQPRGRPRLQKDNQNPATEPIGLRWKTGTAKIGGSNECKHGGRPPPRGGFSQRCS